MRFSSSDPRPRARGWDIHRRAAAATVAIVLLAAAGAGAQDDFLERVNRAVERGSRHLKARFRSLLEAPPRDHTMGRIALPLTALLKSGVPVQDPLVLRAFDFLDELPPTQTYDVACYLFALDIAARRLGEEKEGPGGVTVTTKPRRASGRVLLKMTELVEWLVNARVRGKGSWDYGIGRSRYDYSNSQFAILGLQVGVEHGVRVPKEIFLEIVHHYMRTQMVDGPSMEIRLVFNPPLDQAFTRSYTPKKVRFEGKPGGWNYTGNRAKPYASMTAAGISNLLVAQYALRKLGALASVQRALEDAIYTGMGWVAHRFDEYLGGSYYGLYSLEKVGDLGDVVRFGDHDWYREGAEVIMQKQRPNDGWGDYIDTSFALLFLTRATRVHMHGMPPPTIYTVTEGEGGGRGDQIGDLVFVDALESFISAREFFAYLGLTRKRALLPIAGQVVRNYALDRQAELVPFLVELAAAQDQVGKFARDSLADLTGTREKDLEFYRAWHELYREIRAFVDDERRDVERIGDLLARAPGTRLKERLLDFVERENLVVTAGFLAEELLVPDARYRERVHSILVRFTGERFGLGDGRRRADREAEAGMWRTWWEENAGRVRREQRVREWVERLNRAGSAPAGQERLLADVVGEGRVAVPFILAEMSARRYRIELVLALERISGERLGLLPDPWRRWWREANR